MRERGGETRGTNGFLTFFLFVFAFFPACTEQVEGPAVTPAPVLKASGHVERFTDLMVRDAGNGECHRADHLLEDVLKKMLENPLDGGKRKEIENVLARLDELGAQELGAQLKKYGIKAPVTNNEISDPFPFNLMFATSIGPRGDVQGYLRPETAQGIFVNFPQLLYYNGNKLPFAAAQLGQSFRNEISPQQGILRVREFTQGEIEHFVDPEHKDHPKFSRVADLEMLVFSREKQVSDVKRPVMMKLRDAIKAGIMDNETIAYFIGRVYTFMVAIGINPERMRFRQHLEHEMAHYAQDCWDCEVESSYGWIECVGIADRSAYDLKQHAAATNKEMGAWVTFDKPKFVEELVVEPISKVLGKAFRKDAKTVVNALKTMTEENALKMKAELEKSGEANLKAFCDGGDFVIKKDMVKIAMETKKLSGKFITPGVIEPSFGIGRILYCMFEHTYYVREGAEGEKEDDKKVVFKFTPLVAPTKCTVFPLLQKEDFNAVCRDICSSLVDSGLSTIIDVTGTSIGKRYARTDEIGVPFAVTVDHDTLEDNTVTLRERDTCSQVRIPIADLCATLKNLSNMKIKWEEVQAQYPSQGGSASAAKEENKTEATYSLRCP